MQDLDSRYAPFAWVKGSIELIDSPGLMEAIDVWRSFMNGNRIPVWRVEILAALPLHMVPYANVVDLGNGVPPFSYRFFGTGLAGMHTFELTGKTTEDIEPEGFRNVCIDQSIITRDAGEPAVFLNSIPTRVDGMFSRQTTLRLPLSNDGETVHHILTVEETSDDPAKTWERFARCRPVEPKKNTMD